MSGAAEQKRVVILGSTGSIGRSALEVVRHYPDHFRVVGLAAGSNGDALAAQVAAFEPEFAALYDEAAAHSINTQGWRTRLLTGEEGVEAVARTPADVVLCAMVGAVGLRPVLAAIEANPVVALANKEPVVMAGGLVMARAAACGTTVVPVDSEHNAIFQCLQGHAAADVRGIYLTASGGPFYGRDRDSLGSITPAQACNHPTWNMGAKVSVDSATLMNKGLEIIEAMWLFSMPADCIEVIVHPQSVIHSLVEFNDGHMLAHLGVTDMKFPILFALSYPQRMAFPMERLDLRQLSELSFAEPDFAAFPCLGYARKAAAAGGTVPVALNAANEEAVTAFCSEALPFLGISEVVESVLAGWDAAEAGDLDTIFAADALARERARACIRARV
ncbi:MAG: 1-deoxy-D-xylulose-5-phosphate reductoisomerase [Candidatus Hydrogenedentota bacterium]